MPSYSAQFRIDQPDGGGSGLPGRARTDLWRTKQVNLTPTQPPPGATYEWKMVRPRGSSAVFLAPGGGDGTNHATPHFFPDVWGSYLVQCSINNGVYTFKLIAAVKFDADGSLMKLGWRYPALNEDWLDASDPYGWKQAIEDIFDSLYGVIANLQGHGGHSGDDGGEVRASDTAAPAERRLRVHQVPNAFVQGPYLYTVKRAKDQRQLGQMVVQLVDCQRGLYEPGPIPVGGPPPVEWGGMLSHDTGSGNKTGLLILDSANERPVAVLPLEDLLDGVMPTVTPQSVVVFGTQAAVVLSEGVVVIELAPAIASRALFDPDMAVVLNPDAGGGFGDEARVAFTVDRGMPRLFITDSVRDKVYSTRINLPLPLQVGPMVIP